MTDWNDLARIADTVFQRESRKLAELNQAACLIHERRERLSAMNMKAMSDFRNQSDGSQQDGDVLWQVWLTRNRQNLGIQEARVRAMKEIHLPGLRRAYGKKCVLAKLARSGSKNPT